MADDLRRAWGRVESRRRHRLRTAVLVLAGAGIAAWAVPMLKELVSGQDSEDLGLGGTDET